MKTAIEKLKCIRLLDLVSFLFLIDSLLALWNKGNTETMIKTLVILSFTFIIICFLIPLYRSKNHWIFFLMKVVSLAPVGLAILINNNLLDTAGELWIIIAIIIIDIWIVIAYPFVVTATLDCKRLSFRRLLIVMVGGVAFFFAVVAIAFSKEFMDLIWYGGLAFWTKSSIYFNITYFTCYYLANYQEDM